MSIAVQFLNTAKSDIKTTIKPNKVIDKIQKW